VHLGVDQLVTTFALLLRSVVLLVGELEQVERIAAPTLRRHPDPDAEPEPSHADRQVTGPHHARDARTDLPDHRVASDVTELVVDALASRNSAPFSVNS